MRDPGMRPTLLSRRGFLGGIAASAAAAILAACGGSSSTTSAPTTAPTTAATAAAAATRPATTGSAVSSTPASTAATGGVAVSGTTAASSATSGTVASGTAASGTTSAASGSFTLLPTPSADQFKGQSLQVIARQEYFKEVEAAFDAEVQKFAQMTGTKIENNRINEDTGSVVQKMDAAVKAGNPPDFA
jgi:hypothetical protein